MMINNSSDLPFYPIFIDGKQCEGLSKQTAISYNPANNQPWACFACADKEDVFRAVAAAKRALNDDDWRNMLPTQRGKLLYKLGDLIEKNAENLGRIETKDSGKLAAETVSQVRYAAEYYRYYAGFADKIEGATLPIDKPDMHVFTVREPIGIVAAIVPWNAQMFLTATKLAPALAAGCTIVIKASEIAPCAILEFAHLIEEAGFPKGVVSILTGDAKNCAAPLASHPDIDRLAFTGGPDTARHIVRHSAENFAVTTLELGGKSPIIVFSDANLENATNGIIAGNYGAAGQSCVAGSRVIVHQDIKDKLIARIKERAQDIIVGDPLEANTHVGPLCTDAQIKRIEQALALAQSQGATIHFGGNRIQREGQYFEPTLVECPNKNIETLRVELFGPVISLISFQEEKEAIDMANDSVYGLGSGLFTENLSRGLRISKRIHSGICWVNTYRAISPIAPFGGYNQSGYGREAGIEAILDYTRTKTIWINTSGEPMANPFIIR